MLPRKLGREQKISNKPYFNFLMPEDCIINLPMKSKTHILTVTQFHKLGKVIHASYAMKFITENIESLLQIQKSSIAHCHHIMSTN
jgi:hypothetical protein